VKYFFVVDTKGKRHIVTANDTSEAKKVVANSNIKIDYMYELTEETFKDAGFLFSDK